nr:hypothetical protein Q903MT_gene197 [Picea sitchensis]
MPPIHSTICPLPYRALDPIVDLNKHLFPLGVLSHFTLGIKNNLTLLNWTHSLSEFILNSLSEFISTSLPYPTYAGDATE